MNTLMLNDLISMAKILKSDLGLVHLKGGTEVEDMTFHEIIILNDISNEAGIGSIIKIGGPEARNDIRFLKSIGIHGILSPMIESAYALKNFVTTVQEIYGETELPWLAINIETHDGYLNLPHISTSRFIMQIAQVTIGRSDFAQSCGLSVDSSWIIQSTKEIVDEFRATHITSVGGSVTSDNVEKIKSRINPEWINTRNMVFSSSTKDLVLSIQKGIEFEIELYTLFKDIGSESYKKDFYQKRIDALKSRLK